MSIEGPVHLTDETLALLAGGAPLSGSAEHHIDACESCRRVLFGLLRPERTVGEPLMSRPALLRADLARMEVLAPDKRYVVERPLGQGGMGEVLAVRDASTQRTVAWKRVREGLSPRALPLFLREAQISAQLEHPNIVPVYEMGLGEDGAPYFTMRCVEGRTLRDVLVLLANHDAATCAAYTSTRLAMILLEVTRAVSYAHSRGVVHCDLKPANVLLGPHGEVLVTDWGLARLVAPSDGHAPLSTSVATVEGCLIS